MNAPLPNVLHPGFSLEACDVEGGVCVRFAGTADMHAIQPLDRYLSAIHAKAVARGARRVEVDFVALEFMNSSCFKSFVTWIGQVLELPEEQRYRITFRSNPGLHWQRRSLNALRCFAIALVTVES